MLRTAQRCVWASAVMIEPRLASDVYVKAIRRIAEAQGNFASILYRGDPVSGSVLIAARNRTQIPVIYERFGAINNGPKWQESGPKDPRSEQDVTDWLQNRRSRDPDIWVIELDIASDEQLAVIIGE